VVNKDTGLRTGRRLSHVFLMDVPAYHKLLMVTDAAINIVPTLEDKRDICQNAIDLAHALGIAQPKVAILSAVEDAQAQLGTVADALRSGDEAFLATWIATAAAARSEALAQAHRTAPADLHELLASVPDRPGALSSIAQALSAAGINIEEVSLSHISPERGGEVRIIVAGEDNATRAVELLLADGCMATHAPIIDGAGGEQ
jgi:hypothetical protein